VNGLAKSWSARGSCRLVARDTLLLSWPAVPNARRENCPRKSCTAAALGRLAARPRAEVTIWSGRWRNKQAAAGWGRHRRTVEQTVARCRSFVAVPAFRNVVTMSAWGQGWPGAVRSGLSSPAPGRHTGPCQVGSVVIVERSNRVRSSVGVPAVAVLVESVCLSACSASQVRQAVPSLETVPRSPGWVQPGVARCRCPPGAWGASPGSLPAPAGGRPSPARRHSGSIGGSRSPP
jgi:hypothetical protein